MAGVAAEGARLPLPFRVPEDRGRLLLPAALLPSAALQHPAAQSRLRVRSAALLHPLRRPPLAEGRLPQDPGGEEVIGSNLAASAVIPLITTRRRQSPAALRAWCDL